MGINKKIKVMSYDNYGKFDDVSIPRYKKVSALINRNKGKLLDVGARTAKLKEFISPKIEYFALDFYNKKEISELEERGVKAKNGRIEKIPFKKRSFDVVVLTEILEHLPNPGIALQEVSRVLKKDGIVVVSVPNNDLKRKIYSLMIRIPKYFLGLKKPIKEHELGGHLYMFGKPHINLLFETYGFKVEKWVFSIFTRSIMFRARLRK